MVIKQSSIEKVYQSIIETLSLVLGMPSAIWLLNDKNEMTIRASFGLPEEYKRVAKLGLNEDAIATKVFRSKEPVFVAEIQTEPSWKYKDQAQDIGIKSAWVFPLFIRKKVTGVLDVYNIKSGDFDNKEKQIIASFAEQTALAVSYFEGFELLNDVSLLVNRSLYQKELFDEIMEAAENVLDCEHVSLFLATRDEKLVLKSSSSPKIARTEFAFGIGLAGWVAKEMSPVLVDDVANDERFVPGLSDSSTERSMLVVPILRDKGSAEVKKLVGVISADKHGKAQFNEQDIALMEAFARQAAVALENADLLQQLADRANAFKSLQDAGTNLLYLSDKPEDLDRILWDIAENAHIVLDADLIYVYEYNQQGNCFSLPPTRVGDLYDETVVKKEIFEDDILYKIIQSSAPVYTFNAKEDKTLTQPFTVERDNKPVSRFVVREKIESSAALPLIAASEHVGVLFVNFRTPQIFSDQDKELVELFADQLAIAIHNVRVYRFERTVNDIGRELTSQIDLSKNDILELIHKKAGLVMDVDNMYIALFDEDMDVVSFDLAYVNGQQIDTERVGGWQPRKAGQGKTEEIIRTRKPLFHQTRDEGERWYENHKEYVKDSFSSWVGVPIMTGENVLGVISAYDPQKDYRFSYDDLEILQAIANQAAIALKNVDLYEDSRRRERALIETAQAINERILEGEKRIFEAIHEKAEMVMDVDNMYIASYDATTDVVSFSLAYVEGKPIDVKTHKKWQPRKAGEGKTEEIIRTREPLFHPTQEESEGWYKKKGIEPPVKPVYPSWVGVPILSGEKVLGVIATYHPERDNIYNEDDLHLLEAMANQAAIAIEQSRLYRELEEKITKLEKMQVEIADKERALVLTSMTADFVHRVNNLAGTIPNWAKLAKKRLEFNNNLDDRVLEYLERISAEARFFLQEAKGINQPLPTPEDIDVVSLVDSILGQMEIVASPNVHFSLDSEYATAVVHAIRQQLSDAIFNIIDNGAKAIPGEGTVSVRLKSYSTSVNEIVIEISDTGCGVSEEAQKRIFELGETHSAGGTGYGLWRSRNIIEGIGGSLSLQDTSNEGTTFQIILPVVHYSYEDMEQAT